MALILDGLKSAAARQEALRHRIAALARAGVTPGLVAVRVGADPGSELYVSRKMRACEELGIHSRAVALPEDAEPEALLRTIAEENANPATSGILVQLPLPAAFDTQAVVEAIAPAKDVDGFHPFNVGRVETGVGGFAPCTPLGIVTLLDEHGLDCRGREAVVVGASRIVGRPLANLMLTRGATVTVCHIETKNLADHTKRAEILVVAVGRPGLVTPEMVKRGVIAVDVGITRVPDRQSPRGFRVVGDLAPGVKELAYAITPVPGGIGPMTVAMLMENTVRAAEAILAGEEV